MIADYERGGDCEEEIKFGVRDAWMECRVQNLRCFASTRVRYG